MLSSRRRGAVDTLREEEVLSASTSSVPSRDVEVAGLRVHLNERGSGAPLVVLHHSTGPLWTPFHDALAETYAVAAIDLPGFAQSERPEDARSPRDLAILTLQAIDALELDEFHLVGLGFGGWVAAELATMAGARLSGLTLVGAAGVKPREGFIHDPVTAGFVEYVRLGFHDDAAFDAFFGAEPSKDMIDLWDYSREMTARVTWKPWMWSLVLPTLLRGVMVPAQVIWGSEDAVVPLDCGVQYAEILPNGRLEVIDGAGHLVELERPEAVARLVAEFAPVAS
jgi:pimeloyl-ACP methyl ester carboxylesterase